jgi:hypothetical protein
MVQEEKLTNFIFQLPLKKLALCVYGEYAKWREK